MSVHQRSGVPRVGLLGYGEIARYHARHLAAAGADVIGAVTRRTVASGLKRYGSLGDMLPEVDAVTIAIPNHLHASACLEILAAGKAVFLEKPWCLTTEECSAIEGAALAAGVPVHGGFRLRWNPRLADLRSRLRGARRLACWYRLGIDRLADGKPWTRRRATSGGAWMTLGIHALDLVRWLAGGRGEPLEALTAGEAYADDGADFPLLAWVTGTLNGVRLEAGADLRGGGAFRLELAIDADQPTPPDASGPGPGPTDPGAADVEYAGLMRAFVAAVVEGSLDTAGLRETLQLHRDLLAAAGVVATRAVTGENPRDRPRR
jgi:predicted dehydrogenase